MNKEIRFQHYDRAKHLHQIQLLACSHCILDFWSADNLIAPYWRLYRNTRKGGFLFYESQCIPMRPKCLYLIAPGSNFGCSLSQPIGQTYIHFLMDNTNQSAKHRIHELSPTSEMTNIIDRLMKELKKEDATLSQSLLALQIVAASLDILPKSLWSLPQTDKRLQGALTLIHSSYPKAVSNAVLAREVDLHSSTFIRLFSETIGTTPLRYLQEQRIDEACNLLRNGEMSIDEIAEKTGYCDRGHFTRFFKQITRTTPAAFAQMLRVCR